MASKEAHAALANELLVQMQEADHEAEWAIAVDAGYYAVFHSLEALNALECRDSYTFADAADILQNVLVERVLDRSVRHAYDYLFYFRRGVIYGCHEPTRRQTAEYCRVVEDCIAQIEPLLRGATEYSFVSERR